VKKLIAGLVSLVLALVLVQSACGQTDSETLTVYSGRSEELIGPVIEQFEEFTGLTVKVRYGKTAEMAATIMEEGVNSPADVFIAQDPGGLGAVEHLFADIPDSIIDQVDAKFSSSDNKWVGISGRARVVIYNTDLLDEPDLPDDIWGFVDPEWNGRIGWAPTNSSFQAMLTAMRVLWGETKTRAAVGAGEIEVGFPNHYYLYRFLQEHGESFAARNYHPRDGGPGAVILVAGAGILETSRNKENAQRLLDFMLSEVSQQYFAGQTFEYPVIEGVTINRLLTPLSEINSPEIDMADMSDLDGTLDLLRETGVLP